MYAQLHVVTAEEFAKRPWDVFDDSTPEKTIDSGKALYSSLGCNSCHTTNGAPSTGPTWKGLFVKNADGTVTGKKTEVIEGGKKETVTIDFDYIAESIRKPDQQKVVGFETQNMSPFDLDDRRIKAIIAYMKTLAE